MMKKAALLLITIFLLQGCTNLHIEKRRYRKGFHVSWNHNKKSDGNAKTEELKKDNPNKNLEKTLTPSTSAAETLTPKKEEVTPENQEIEVKTVVEIANADVQLDETNSDLEAKTTSTSKKESKTKTKKKEGKSMWLTTLLFFTLALFVPLFILRPRFKNLSIWASNNINKTRWLIAGLQIALLLITLTLGVLSGITIAPWVGLFSLALLFIATIGYYITHRSPNKAREKRIFFMNLFNLSGAISGFALGANGFLSNPKKLFNWDMTSGVSEYNNGMGDGTVMSWWAILLLTILLLALLAGTLALLVGISCSLACETSAILGAIVFFGGGFILFTAFFYAMFFIFRKPNSSKKRMFLIAMIIAAAISIIVALLLFLGS